MLVDYITIGTKLEITLFRDKELGFGVAHSHVSQVEEVVSENVLIIHMPIAYGQYIRLSTKEKYSLLFFTSKGIVRFDAKIIEHIKVDDFNYMKVSLLSGGEKVQRRDFFRFPCLLPVKLTAAAGNEQEVFDGIIKDLGGGGIRFVSNHLFSQGDRICCMMMLNDECLIEEGMLLSKEVFPEETYRFQYRVKFAKIREAEQEKIIQYIFYEQRKMLLKIR